MPSPQNDTTFLGLVVVRCIISNNVASFPSQSASGFHQPASRQMFIDNFIMAAIKRIPVLLNSVNIDNTEQKF